MAPFDNQSLINDKYEVVKDSSDFSVNTPATQKTCTQTCGCTSDIGADFYVPPQQQLSSIDLEVPATQKTCTQTCGCSGDGLEQIDYIAPALK